MQPACARMIAFAICIATTTCGRQSASSSEPGQDHPVPVLGSRSQPESIRATLARESETGSQRDPRRFMAVLAPSHAVDVVARRGGIITAILAREGSLVRAGDLLAKIDDREPQASLLERSAEADKAREALRRASILHAKSMISDQQFADARSDMQIAEAREKVAHIAADDCSVRAPINGVIMLRLVQPGQTVSQGARLFRVIDPTRLEAEIPVPESQLGQLRTGQPVRILVNAMPRPYPARITRICPAVDAESGTIRVTVEMDNLTLKLVPNQTVQVQLDSLSTYADHVSALRE